ncbi:MAG: F0F1 ATP synthase subunit B [Bifidobacteriaceae bacterium]|jgi:F-type H+-transporting ATPase subunit b|nr:F0F1 ATP synthase subunit B [Bifidobacteriaceae bacterium]
MTFLHLEESTSGVDIFIPKAPEIFWSALVIIIIAFCFYKYILPRLNKTLNERTDKIDGQIKTATKANQDAQKAKADYETQLTGAAEDAKNVKIKAQKDADSIIEEAKEKANESANRSILAAQKTIDANKTAAFVSLKKDIGNIATEFATKIIKEKVSSDKEQLKSIDKFLDNLEISDGK